MAKTPEFSQSDLNPVGMIAQSMLTEIQFQAANGAGWILADGRDITGSRYEDVTGLTEVPDARGLVLRGQNGTRNDGDENPDDPALGDFQDHNTAPNGLSAASAGSHRHHGYGGGSGADGVGASWSTNTSSSLNGNYVTESTGSHGHTVTGGGNETRMRNITVNTFIKIN